MPRAPRWTEAELAYLRDAYARREPLADIAVALRRPYKTVSTKASRLGLALREQPRAWSTKDDCYLRAHYESMPTTEIARALGRSHGTIKRRADGLGMLSVKRRARAAVQDDYFADIDDPVKAYILGIWASDGWVSGTRNEIGIGMHPKDADLAVLLRDQLAPLSRILQSRNPEHPRLDLRISSPRMRSDLIRLGVTPQKSLTLRWPAQLPDNLQNSFILGCFDGDGCLSYEAKRNYYHWSLVSASRPFLEEVRTRMRAATGVKIQGPYAHSHSRALAIQYVGPRIYDLDDWLHADVSGLARKRPRPAT